MARFLRQEDIDRYVREGMIPFFPNRGKYSGNEIRDVDEYLALWRLTRVQYEDTSDGKEWSLYTDTYEQFQKMKAEIKQQLGVEICVDRGFR